MMKVYKLKLKKDDRTYWLTEKLAFPIMKAWKDGEKGMLEITPYGVMSSYTNIDEIREVEENGPFPKQFQDQLVKEGVREIPPTQSHQGIKRLPTDILILDSKLRPYEPTMNRHKLYRLWKDYPDHIPYFYEASVHYKEGPEGKEYYLQFEDIKCLVKERFSEECDYFAPLMMTEYRYGVENAYFRK